ncbi:MAG: CRISPR-associated endonuclease Cas2 [Bacillota bacterium]|jgi:CRISPR-associated protein Cas2|nr:CRISPR-associated endonuclease Cas2 [Syntrophomonadaceae bacterium]
MLKNIVIVYDIANDRRRTRVFKLLKNYATRIQYSVFEGNLTDEDVIHIQAELTKIMNPKEDGIAIFQLCKKCIKTVKRIGVTPEATGTGDIIV